MNLLVPALVLVGAVVATYLFCVRPMRRGGCTMTGTMQSCSSRQDDHTASSDLDAELTRARQELALLRKRAEAGRHASS